VTDGREASAGPREALPAARRAGHLPALDGARGLAILLVLMFHFGGPFPGEPDLPSKLLRASMAGGWVGVDLFFVLSGFLITRNLLADDGDRRGVLLRFWRNRALRIFPAYYLFLIAHTLLSSTPSACYWLYYCNWTRAFDAVELGSARSHLWSLAIEEQFYLLWPLLVLGLSRRRLVWLAWTVVVLAPLLRGAALLAHAEPMLVYRGTPFRIDALVWGALIALGARWQALPWLGAALTLPIVIWCRGFAFGAAPMQVVGYSGIALFFAGAVGWAVTRAPRWLELRGLRLAGRYSYGAYLLHWPLAAAGWDHFSRQPLGLARELGWVALQALGVLAAAALSYELVEKRFLRLRSARPPTQELEAAPP
jgi:peptidoglycan/LPS O-acetylase OafA/YrhL